MNKRSVALSFAAVAVCFSVAFADPQEVHTFAGPFPVYASGNPANSSFTVTFTTQGYPPGGLNITMDMSALAGAPGTLASDVIVSVTPPSGDAYDVSMGPAEEFGQLVGVTQIVPFGLGVEPAGTWAFRIYDASQQGDGVSPEEFVSNVQFGLEVATEPGASMEFLPVAEGSTVVPDQFHGASGVTWYRMMVPALDDVAHPRFLDILTGGNQFVDSYIGLYDDTGRIRATDDDSGTGHGSFLSFGYGGGPSVGGGGVSDAQAISDGRSGKLSAGTYWLVVSEYGGGAPIFNAGWHVQPPPEGAGFTYTLTLSLGTTPGGGLPPTATSVGTLGFVQGTESEAVGTAEVAQGQTGWFSFTIGHEVSLGAGAYLDIVIDPATTMADPEIGLYTAGGVLTGTDDDDGPDFDSFLSFGAGGGTTTGNTEITTTHSDGRDGALTAGTYYLAAGEYNTTFGNAFNTTVNGGESSGTAVVNFRTGLVAPTGGQCGPADIGVAGGVPGHDGHLDNNDFIAFINYFFAQDPIADKGVAGGLQGSDGHFDNNDFIAFITQFFAGC